MCLQYPFRYLFSAAILSLWPSIKTLNCPFELLYEIDAMTRRIYVAYFKCSRFKPKARMYFQWQG